MKSDLEKIFKKTPNSIFFEDIKNQKKISFKEFFERSKRIANFLIDKENLRKGDKVIIRINHSVIFYEFLIACAIIGIVVCPISTSITSKRFREIKNLIKPKLLIFSEKEIFFSARDMLPNTYSQTNYNQDFLIIFSSGTTSGRPKGITHTLGNILESAQNFSILSKFTKNDVFHAFWPQHHMTGIFNLFFVPLVTSSKIILSDEFKIFLLRKLFAEANKFNVTKLYLSPTMCSMAINFRKDLLKNFKFKKNISIISTASILYPSTFLKFKKIFKKNILKCYGVTELGGSLTIDLKPNIKGDFCVGKFSKNTKIFCKGTKKSPGKIYINSKFFMSNLINSTIRKNKLYDTGDIGYLNKGKLFVLGRTGDNVKKNGEFVSLSEIENLVIDIDGIKNAMAVPYKDEIYGFKIKLFVEIQDKQSKLDIKNKLQNSFNLSLSKNEEPDQVIFKNKILKTSTGKNIKFLYQ